jgi:ATP-dependent RNA helicase DOB1
MPGGSDAAAQKIELLERRLADMPFHHAPDREARFQVQHRRVELDAQVAALRSQLRHSESTVLTTELKHMKRVLRRLGYTNAENVIETKGRVACEVNTADELIVTELMFNGVFNTMLPEHIAALLSALIFQEKGDDQPKIRAELTGPLRQMQEVARRIAKVSKESKLALDEEAYVGTIKPALMEVVYCWATVRSPCPAQPLLPLRAERVAGCRAPSLPTCAR